MNKSRTVRRKARGILKTKKELFHLLAEKTKREQAATKLVAKFESELRVADAEIRTDEYRFASLGSGFNMEKSGRIVSDDEFLDQYNAETERRDHYYRLTDKSGGRFGLRREKVTYPIHKDTITPHSRHDHVLLAFDAAGVDIGPLVKKAAAVVAEAWDRESRNERVLWVIVHANAGRLHFHPLTTRIELPKIANADKSEIKKAKGLAKLDYRNRRVNKASRPGNNRESFAGVALIAIERLHSDGDWPDKWAAPALGYLEEKFESVSGAPLDFVVSVELDRFLENEIEKLKEKDPKLRLAAEEAERLHKERVELRVRRHKMEAIASDNEAVKILEAEIAERARKVEEQTRLATEKLERAQEQLHVLNQQLEEAQKREVEQRKALNISWDKFKKGDELGIRIQSEKARLEERNEKLKQESEKLKADHERVQRLVQTLQYISGAGAELAEASKFALEFHREESSATSQSSFKERYENLVQKLVLFTADQAKELGGSLLTLDSLEKTEPSPREPSKDERDSGRDRQF